MRRIFLLSLLNTFALSWPITAQPKSASRESTIEKFIDLNRDGLPDGMITLTDRSQQLILDNDFDGEWDYWELDDGQTRIELNTRINGTFLRFKVLRRLSTGLLEIRYAFSPSENRYKIISTQQRPYRVFHNAIPSDISMADTLASSASATCRRSKNRTLSGSVEDLIQAAIEAEQTETKKVIHEAQTIDSSCNQMNTAGNQTSNIAEELSRLSSQTSQESEGFLGCLASNGWPIEAARLRLYLLRLHNGFESKLIRCEPKPSSTKTSSALYQESTGQIVLLGHQSDLNGNLNHEYLHKAGVTSEREIQRIGACCDPNNQPKTKCTPNTTDELTEEFSSLLSHHLQDDGTSDLLIDAYSKLDKSSLEKFAIRVEQLKDRYRQNIHDSNTVCDTPGNINQDNCKTLVLEKRLLFNQQLFNEECRRINSPSTCANLKELADQSVKKEFKKSLDNCTATPGTSRCPYVFFLQPDDRRKATTSNEVQRTFKNAIAEGRKKGIKLEVTKGPPIVGNEIKRKPGGRAPLKITGASPESDPSFGPLHAANAIVQQTDIQSHDSSSDAAPRRGPATIKENKINKPTSLSKSSSESSTSTEKSSSANSSVPSHSAAKSYSTKPSPKILGIPVQDLAEYRAQTSRPTPKSTGSKPDKQTSKISYSGARSGSGSGASSGSGSGASSGSGSGASSGSGSHSSTRLSATEALKPQTSPQRSAARTRPFSPQSEAQTQDHVREPVLGPVPTLRLESGLGLKEAQDRTNRETRKPTSSARGPQPPKINSSGNPRTSASHSTVSPGSISPNTAAPSVAASNSADPSSVSPTSVTHNSGAHSTVTRNIPTTTTTTSTTSRTTTTRTTTRSRARMPASHSTETSTGMSRGAAYKAMRTSYSEVQRQFLSSDRSQQDFLNFLRREGIRIRPPNTDKPLNPSGDKTEFIYTDLDAKPVITPIKSRSR